MQVRALPERTVRVLRDAVDRDRMLKRHLEPGWPEWSLRELARYFYVLGVFALVVFGLLQISTLWTGWFDPGVVVLDIAFVLGVLYLGAHGYGVVWGQAGWVDRFLARKGLAPAPREGPDGDR